MAAAAGPAYSGERQCHLALNGTRKRYYATRFHLADSPACMTTMPSVPAAGGLGIHAYPDDNVAYRDIPVSALPAKVYLCRF